MLATQIASFRRHHMQSGTGKREEDERADGGWWRVDVLR